MLSNTVHRFWLGVMMSAVNPVQIPFWFGWSTVLFTRNILHPTESNYLTYIAGIGLGTLAGNCLFIFGGKLLVSKLNTNQHLLQIIIGCVFGLTALIQLWKMIRQKDAISTMKTNDQSLTRRVGIYSIKISHLLGPFSPVIRSKLPGCKIIFHISKHHGPFLWCIAFFHHQVTAHLQNNIKRTDTNRAFLHTGIAGCTGTQFFC